MAARGRLLEDRPGQFPGGGVLAEGPSRMTMELEPLDGAVKLTVTHAMDRAESQLIQKVSGGWPGILSNLKSLLETGEVAVTKF